MYSYLYVSHRTLALCQETADTIVSFPDEQGSVLQMFVRYYDISKIFFAFWKAGGKHL